MLALNCRDDQMYPPLDRAVVEVSERKRRAQAAGDRLMGSEEIELWL